MKTILKNKITLATTALLIIGTVLTSCSKEEGCTDPAATNFNIDADKDDGSCKYEAATTEEHHEAHLNLNFSHNFDGLPVSAANFNQFNYITANGDTINIIKLRYLISDVTLYTTSGQSIVLSGHNLVDLADVNTLNYTAGAVDIGSYAGIGFNFGFDTTDNKENYIDLNSASWNVPMMMGGGYHNMQLEGKYKYNGIDSTYAYHHIAKKRPTMMAPFEANHIVVRLDAISFNQHNVSININMNIAEWFKNPTNWDLNTYHSSLMMNYTAQDMMLANGYNVFSLGSVFQKQ